MLLAARDRADVGEDAPTGFTDDELRDWLPEAPAGMTIRDYRPGDDDAALHAMHQEAFAEHWEFTPSPLDEWLNWRQTRRDYHPALWQMAEENGAIAGAALCFGEDRFGWVLDLAVRPTSRRAGLGLVLLHSGLVALCGAATRASGSRWTPRTRRARRASTNAPA